nr:Abi family protein [Clavibacter michiganensis]
MTDPLSALVSEPRLRKYRAASGDPEVVKELYATDMRLSAAAFKALNMCEIVMRNAMDRELRKWNAKNGYGEWWTLDPAGLLKGCFINDADDLEKARRKATKALSTHGRVITHDDVVAQLSFGAWRYLLPPNNPHLAKEKIWEEALEGAFPSHRGTRAALVKSAAIAYDLRNRVAHHEPVFHLDLQAKRRNIKDLIDAVSREARTWFIANDTFTAEITTFQQFQSRHKLVVR